MNIKSCFTCARGVLEDTVSTRWSVKRDHYLRPRAVILAVLYQQELRYFDYINHTSFVQVQLGVRLRGKQPSRQGARFSRSHARTFERHAVAGGAHCCFSFNSTRRQCSDPRSRWARRLVDLHCANASFLACAQAEGSASVGYGLTSIYGSHGWEIFCARSP
jgi:hypothetical protein